MHLWRHLEIFRRHAPFFSPMERVGQIPKKVGKSGGSRRNVLIPTQRWRVTGIFFKKTHTFHRASYFEGSAGANCDFFHMCFREMTRDDAR